MVMYWVIFLHELLNIILLSLAIKNIEGSDKNPDQMAQQPDKVLKAE